MLPNGIPLPFTLRQLEIFEAVCAERSFRKAGERLGISQASVSNQLKTLEFQLGAKLLLRARGKSPQLTAEGAAFLADLAGFREASIALASHRRANPEDGGPQPVKLQGVIGPYLFSDFIRPKLDHFFELHPHIELDVVAPVMVEDPQLICARENCDFALYHDPLAIPHGPEYREVARSPCGVYGLPELVGRRKPPISSQALSQLPFILPPAGSFREQHYLAALAKGGIKPLNIIGRSGYFDVMIRRVERGKAVCAALEALFVHVKGRKSVMLRRLEDWHVVLYCSPARKSPELDSVTTFLTSALLDDPAFPTVERFEAAA